MLQVWTVDTPINRRYLQWRHEAPDRVVLVWPSRVRQRLKWTAATTETAAALWNIFRWNLETTTSASNLLTAQFRVGVVVSTRVAACVWNYAFKKNTKNTWKNTDRWQPCSWVAMLVKWRSEKQRRWFDVVFFFGASCVLSSMSWDHYQWAR